jgi:hypothetical protein
MEGKLADAHTRVECRDAFVGVDFNVLANAPELEPNALHGVERVADVLPGSGTARDDGQRRFARDAQASRELARVPRAYDRGDARARETQRSRPLDVSNADDRLEPVSHG